MVDAAQSGVDLVNARRTSYAVMRKFSLPKPQRRRPVRGLSELPLYPAIVN